MSNLPVSYHKIFMFLFLALAVFYSCTADEDILLEVVNQNGTEKQTPVDRESSGTSTTIPANETDTTDVSNKPDKSLLALATPSSGVPPLEVAFSVSNSLSEKIFTKYEWKFKDGTKVSSSKAVHTFKEVGKHEVELTATNEEGQVLIDSVTVTVIEPANQAPVAVAVASVLSGEAPLQVAFTGSGSSDDKGVVGYSWDFQGASSSSANTAHTFDDPGVYNVALTVTDGQGLQDTAALTVTVDQGSTGNAGGKIPCSVGGGRANQTGAKIWCWENVSVPSGASSGTVGFSDGELALNIECSANQVVREGNRLKFALNPTSPSPASWCNNDYNMRAEIRTMPWNVDHPSGTEEWFGFSYTFGNTYRIDTTGNWSFWQVHENTIGASPLLSLQIDGRSGSSYDFGELMLSNTSQPIGNNKNSNYGTGIVPVAGQTLDIVMHVIWGDDSTGLWQVWVDGAKVHDLQARTVRAADPVGGNSKFGIYYSPWRSQSSVEASAAAGVTHIETYMGPLRMITRRPGDADYRKDSYNEVSPE